MILSTKLVTKCSRWSSTPAKLQTLTFDSNINNLILCSSFSSFLCDFLLFLLWLDLFNFLLFLLDFNFLLFLLFELFLLEFSEFLIRIKVHFFFFKLIHNFFHQVLIFFRLLVFIVNLGQFPLNLIFKLFSKSVSGLNKTIFTLTKK